MEEKRAWIYCRVAHVGPDSAEALELQRNELEAYAKEHGYEIAGCSSDIRNGPTMDRPGLLDFQVAAEKGNVDVLLIRNLSRLGRDNDKVIKYWHMLRDIGVNIHTVDCGKIDFSVEETCWKCLRI